MFGTRRMLHAAVTTAACCGLALSGTLVAGAAPGGNLPGKLTRDVTVDGINRHLIAMQRIADSNGGNRAADTPGYDASVEYLAGLLRAAGFEVSTPEFGYDAEIVDAALLDVAGTQYVPDQMEFAPNTPEGGVTGSLVVVPEDETTGCEAADYTGIDPTGGIALIRRGGCTFAQKQQVAADLGAIAAVISNNAPGPMSGTLGDPSAARIPTAGILQAEGDELVDDAGAETTLDTRVHFEPRVSRNVIAQTRSGRTDNVVMAGAHLDSVPEGPGINDNGTGSAALLETALQLGGNPRVNNAVRFAWWGAEELGLLGSEAYVAGLSFTEQLDIALYLNFDMVGSPNAGYFAYDGDDSDGEGSGPGPEGSAQIETAFVDYLQNRVRVPVRGTDFSGRSDYGPFIAVGIPSGGLFTGAEGIKTEEQAQLWGGEAGIAYDPCYHQACDTLSNVDRVALDRNADAIAWVTAGYALSTEDVNGVPSRAQRAALRTAAVSPTATTPHYGTTLR